jgi:hypothetical protein
MGNPISDLVGKKPKVPSLNLPDISKVQIDAAAGNAATLPESMQTGTTIDKYNLEQLAKAFEFLSPGSFSKVQSSINSQLNGELSPEDTQATIRSATAAGYGKGFNFGAGGIGRNFVLRDLGLSVENQRQRGLTNFMNLTKLAPARYDPTSMFLTSAQRLQAETQQAEERFNRDWLESQIKAAPSPLGQFIQNVVYAVAGTAGKYFGVANGGGRPAASSSAAGDTSNSGQSFYESGGGGDFFA